MPGRFINEFNGLACTKVLRD